MTTLAASSNQSVEQRIFQAVEDDNYTLLNQILDELFAASRAAAAQQQQQQQQAHATAPGGEPAYHQDDWLLMDWSGVEDEDEDEDEDSQ